MGDTSGKTSIGQLILWPALITLAITILRLVGELNNWSPLLFSREPGGHFALMGISWLPLILGPYFALKLAANGEGTSSMGKAIGLTGVGLVVMILGGAIVGKTIAHPGGLTLAGFVVMLVAAFIPGVGWRALGKTLLAYAFAARIPVAIVMYIAMSANGGKGWGTHYDALPPNVASASLAQRFFGFALLPQLCLWVAYTVVIGALLGEIVTALFARKPVVQTA